MASIQFETSALLSNGGAYRIKIQRIWSEYEMAWMTRTRASISGFLVALAAATLGSSVTAEVDVIAVDFGQSPGPSCGDSPLYSGSFDGSSDFIAMTISDCGSVESPSLDLGNGATFSFTDVTGWNNTDGVPATEVQALTGDHFFSNWEGSGPVSFSLDGFDPTDIVILELLDRRGGESALVTFNGVDTLVSSDALGEFTDVSGGGVTGQTFYSGSFTGAEGFGEGNLAGARITIIPGDPDCEGDLCEGGTGDCNEPRDIPGCSCEPCEEIVCGIDPVCCEVFWDDFCVSLAISNCVP